MAKILIDPSTKRHPGVLARKTLTIVADVHGNTSARINTIPDKTCPLVGDGIDITREQE